MPLQYCSLCCGSIFGATFFEPVVPVAVSGYIRCIGDCNNFACSLPTFTSLKDALLFPSAQLLCFLHTPGRKKECKKQVISPPALLRKYEASLHSPLHRILSIADEVIPHGLGFTFSRRERAETVFTSCWLPAYPKVTTLHGWNDHRSVWSLLAKWSLSAVRLRLVAPPLHSPLHIINQSIGSTTSICLRKSVTANL